MLRVQEDIEHLAALDDLTGVNDGHAITHASDHVHAVCDQHNGQPEAAIDIDQQSQNGLRGFGVEDRKSTRLNSSHVKISYAVFCLKKKKTDNASNRNER